MYRQHLLANPGRVLLPVVQGTPRLPGQFGKRLRRCCHPPAEAGAGLLRLASFVQPFLMPSRQGRFFQLQLFNTAAALLPMLFLQLLQCASVPGQRFFPGV